MKSTNLKKFLEEYKVEVPILQRDYAQGRKSQESVAKEFLRSIFDVLDGKKESLHIDFIYGYKEKDKFILIDGQQRVTTLWLLHFYLYKKADRLDEIQSWLEHFSYNTRESSAKFCENLLLENFDMVKKPSEAIIKKGGAFESAENLRNDPTIKAMLNMLDLIFEQVKDRSDFSKLSSNLDLITFDLFDMGEFGLGEELYIKMNARGRQLSRYENLKSFIEKGSASRDKELLIRIDTQWSDYFFDPENIDSFDTRGFNFLHYANLFFRLEQGGVNSEDIKNSNHAIDELFYHPLQKLENIKLLDLVIELRNSISFKESSDEIKKSSFFDKELDYKSICYFFAILHLVRRVENDKNKISNANDYLRVCKHFIENHALGDPDHIKSFFKLFKHLSQDFENIYQFLDKDENSSYSFNANIYNLEVRKAKLIVKSRDGGEEWEEILEKTSDHPVLIGWVDFLLDFSDEKFEYQSYKGKRKLTYKNPHLEKFKQYANLTMSILDKERFLGDNLSLFKRAFLCIGHYGVYTTNWFYGNIPDIIYRDREAMNWILSGVKNDEKMPYFKEFLDRLIDSGANAHNLKEQMDKIIDSTNLSDKKWWEQLLIKQEEMFDFIDGGDTILYRYRRVRFFLGDDTLKKNLKKITKVELLPNKQNTRNVRCLLDFAFYCYCKKRGLRVVPLEYECDEEQNGHKHPIQSHFSVNDMKVICDSKKSEIIIGNYEPFKLNLEQGKNIFDEFDKIIDEIRCLQ